jgi:hypothetical protein
MPRLDRGIQYAAASRLLPHHLGVLDRPIKSGDDTFVGEIAAPPKKTAALPSGNAAAGDAVSCDQLLRRPSAARFHCATLSAIMRVDFIAAWLSWA